MINNFSLSSFKIMPIAKNYETGERIELGIATAFFYNYQDKIYLITNWHNVTGKNSLTKQPMDSTTSVLPFAIDLYFHTYTQLEDGTKAVTWTKTCSMELYTQVDDDYIPAWFEHPIHENKVDVVAIPFDESIESLKAQDIAVIPVNSPDLNLVDFHIRTGMDAFLLGYPLGLSGGGQLPIWKRGSVASEFFVDIGGLPQYLIDTATTKKGMSGSPIFIKSDGLTLPKGKTSLSDMLMSSCFTFGGIYSGRTQIQHPTEMFPDLAIAWKESAIIEIIEGKKSNYKFYG